MISMKQIGHLLEEHGYLEEGILNEAGLSRILKHTERPFAIITAFRSNFSTKENRQRNRKLESSFKKMKAGAIKLVGHWEEAPDGMTWKEAKTQGKAEDVTEESYFVPMPQDMQYNSFREAVISLAKKFNQDAVVIGNGEEVLLVDKGNNKIGTIGKATFGKLGQAYSTLRGHGKLPFVFEGTVGPSNNIHRMVLKERGLSWV